MTTNKPKRILRRVMEQGTYWAKLECGHKKYAYGIKPLSSKMACQDCLKEALSDTPVTRESENAQ